MKKTLFILLILIAVSSKDATAQTSGVPDTLAYLQSIVANKSIYIGQPFSRLLTDLQIQIKFFFPFASIHYAKNKETSTEFSFYFPLNADEIYLTYPSLRISWQPYLNAAQSRLLYTQYRSVGWCVPIADFYANGIISDIEVRE